MTMQLATVALADIKVGEGHRSDLGDIGALVDSIRRVGLTTPPVIDGDHNLLLGRRRLEALMRLAEAAPSDTSRQFVDVVVTDALGTALAKARSVAAENTQRSPLRLSEIVRLAADLESLEGPELEKARRHLRVVAESAGTGQLDGTGADDDEPADDPTSLTEVVCEQLGITAKTLSKARYVVEVATQTRKYPKDVRSTAQEAMAKMDATGVANGPYVKVRRAVRWAAVQKAYPWMVPVPAVMTEEECVEIADELDKLSSSLLDGFAEKEEHYKALFDERRTGASDAATGILLAQTAEKLRKIQGALVTNNKAIRRLLDSNHAFDGDPAIRATWRELLATSTANLDDLRKLVG